MYSKLQRGVWSSLLLALSILPVTAQNDESSLEIEEVLVTARKHEVDLQKAPTAVTAVSGQDFEDSNIVRLDNFNGYAPGLIISKNDGAGRVVSIRGVGWETAQNLSTQPSVLVYVDGVYLANPLALGLDLGEVERIEVLRGPQGTEFGQGTTGGAINIITRKPTFGETGGVLSLSLGTYDLLKGTASLNLPVGDTFAIGASFQKYDRDGFASIEGGALDGYDLDDADSANGHLNMHWIPSGSLSLRFSGFWQDSDQHGAAQKHLADPNPDPRQLTQDYPGSFALYNHNLALTLDWQSPWGFNLKYLAGYQELRKRQSMDGDRLTESLTAVDLTGFGPANFDVLPFWDNDSTAFSHELNLTHKTEKLEWVLGAYYLDHENTNFFLEAAGPGPFSQYADLLANPSPETLPPFTTPLEFVEDRTLTREDGALYGQFTYRLNPILALTAGGRWQKDKSIDRTTQFWFIDSEQVLADTALTWKAGLDLQLSEDHLLYFLVSTGWKNGGANPGALNGGALDVPVNFEPEEVTALEIGSKNMLYHERVRLNGVVFFYDYEQYQFIMEDPIPFSGGTGNIPKVQIYGLESEFSLQLSKNLRLDGNLALMDGEITDDFLTLDVVDFLNSGFGRFTETGVADRAGLRVNLKGNTPPKLADVTGRLLLSHAYHLGNGARLDTRLDYVYRGSFQYRVFNNPAVDKVPAYDTVSLVFKYQFAGMPLSLSLSATNLLDEDGVNSRYSNPYGLHTTSEEFIPPREVFGTLRYRF